MTTVAKQKIGIIDFGGQYAHLISSRIRRLGAYTEIISNEEPLTTYQGFAGLVLSGGPGSVYETGAPLLAEEVLHLGVPILGICYGHQLVMKLLGGGVEQSQKHEYGSANLQVDHSQGFSLLQGLAEEESVWMSHGDEVTQLPTGFVSFAKSENCRYAGVYHPEKKIMGIQFHPEVTHSKNGSVLLQNFISLCQLSHSWDLQQFLQEKLEEIRQEVGDKKVFMLVSGGVDSTVAYTLLAQAIGSERVKGLLVDTGFMRKGEVEDLQKNLSSLGINIHIANEAERYYSALVGNSEPEKKRKIIGQLFLDIREDYSRSFGLNEEEWILGQGTIYPDTIESGGTKHSHNIKTHHNRVEAILDLIAKGLIIEPIKELYKDEVRELGQILGIAKKWIVRHPFPGPGLAVRMLGDTFAADIDGSKIDAVGKRYPGSSYQVLPIHSVGVQGDKRSYKHCVALNDFSEDWSVYNRIATEITNEASAINRVVVLPMQENLDSLVENPFAMDKKHSDLLREADAIVTDSLQKFSLVDSIWQFPVVLLPFGASKDSYSIVLRPVESQEAMTANFYPMQRSILQTMVASLLAIPKISYVFYDITNKPPGTIEWE